MKRRWWKSIIKLLIISLLVLSVLEAEASEVKIGSLTTTAGYEFTVDMYIEGVNNLYGAAFDLVYDDNMIGVVDNDGNPSNGIQPKIIEGTILNEGGSAPTILLSALEDGNRGRLVVGFVRSGQIGGVDVSTEKKLLSITFKALSSGSTSITFANHNLRDSTNADISVDSWAEALVNINPVGPKITKILPTSGPIGTTVTVEGENFGTTEIIKIDFGTTETITTTSSTNGTFSCSFIVNEQPIGATVITATGLLSGLVGTATFTITPTVKFAEHLGEVIVYPNPYKAWKHDHITFGHPREVDKRLTAYATIKIFNIAGELVRTLEVVPSDNGEKIWNVDNDSGEKVASGIYIYLITNPKGEKCIGKIGIIK
ncbi:MAG: cohesin domain-containing protein [bacterium]